MKILKLLICFLPFNIAQAQVYNETNSLLRKAIVLYQMDANGFYQKTENISVPLVNNITDSYAYNKKSHELYVQTATGNYVITVADNYAKFLKKNKSIPQLKDKELDLAVSRVNSQLEDKFAQLNAQRQKHIEDSIAKAKVDSIEKVRADSIRMVELSQRKVNYRKQHDWQWVPISKNNLSCSLCNKAIFSKDSIFCIGFRNDTLFHVSYEDLALGITFAKIHPMAVPSSLKSDSRFRYHFEVFGDSLRTRYVVAMNEPDYFNYLFISNAADKVKKDAPYGFFDEWGWNNEYGIVTFNCKYTNTNKATIKYIDIYWKITNDVNDVRKTGHFKGTGPVEEWDTAGWSWDYSSYYVAGDASNMEITKVIITYTNGSQKTLSKSMIRFN